MEEQNKFIENESKLDWGKVINGLLIIIIVAAIILGRNSLINFLQSTLEVLQRYFPYFVQGFIVTIILSFISVVFGTILGALLYFGGQSNIRVLRGICSIAIEILRGTPMLLQLFIAYFGIGGAVDFRSSGIPSSHFAFVVGAIAVSINSGAYVAEIIRSGIQSIPKGQIEAGRSLGMTGAMTMKEIIMPQALKNIFPALINEFIAIIKETSIVSTIGVTDIMYNVNLVRGNSYKSMEPLLISGVLYFAITYTLSKVVGVVERRLNNAQS